MSAFARSIARAAVRGTLSIAIAAAILAFVAISGSAFLPILVAEAHGQTLSGLGIGDREEKTEEIAGTSMRERSGPFTMHRWDYADGNSLRLTTTGGAIIYMESNWGGEARGRTSDFPGLTYGRTTLAEIRAMAGSNGFAFSEAGPAQPMDDGIAMFNSYEIEGSPGVAVTFVTKVPHGANVTGATMATAAVLESIILADIDYQEMIWGDRIPPDRGYVPIQWGQRGPSAAAPATAPAPSPATESKTRRIVPRRGAGLDIPATTPTAVTASAAPTAPDGVWVYGDHPLWGASAHVNLGGESYGVGCTGLSDTEGHTAVLRLTEGLVMPGPTPETRAKGTGSHDFTFVGIEGYGGRLIDRSPDGSHFAAPGTACDVGIEELSAARELLIVDPTAGPRGRGATAFTIPLRGSAEALRQLTASCPGIRSDIANHCGI